MNAPDTKREDIVANRKKIIGCTRKQDAPLHTHEVAATHTTINRCNLPERTMLPGLPVVASVAFMVWTAFKDQ